jgi:ribosomal protein L37AE/L43A
MTNDVSAPIVTPEAIERARDIERRNHDIELCVRNKVCPKCAHDLTTPDRPYDNLLVCNSCGYKYSSS